MYFWPPEKVREMSTADLKTLVTFRLSERLALAVKEIAARDDETQSTVIRQLLRLGLEQRSLRSNDPGAAA